MVNHEEQFIHGFITGTNGPQDLFNKCIEGALFYKYKEITGIIGPINDMDITNAIFGLKASDKMDFYGQKINGQKLKEIFIVSIYLQYLDKINPEKSIILSLPQEETSYDVAVYLAPKNAYTIISGNRVRMKNTERGTAFLIQVKEEFDFTTQGVTKPQKIDVKSLENKTKKYNELVLIYIRKFIDFNSDDTKKYLKLNKNIGLIMSILFEPSAIEVLDGPDKGKKIILEEGKYNFLIAADRWLVHIKFKRPESLIKSFSNYE